MKSNTAYKSTDLEKKIFTTDSNDFTATAIEIFRFQYDNCTIYRQFCQSLHTDIEKIDKIHKIPFLPIQFFKTRQIKTTEFEAEKIFESSGTTQTVNSRHFVKKAGIYEESFITAFSRFYGNPDEWCILALLPSYLERQHSSLVMMTEKLISLSQNPKSGFYLYNVDELFNTIQESEQKQRKTLLLGATFALLDFAEKFSAPLQHTTIMETGGMKGRREELTREQVHAVLKQSFKTDNIHSEYGMTELLSQAYSKSDGIFYTPPWMKILVRYEDDPLSVHTCKKDEIVSGAVNMIDLANLYSCSFIATDDLGKIHPDGGFEILGRMDNSDIRGCSLLTV